MTTESSDVRTFLRHTVATLAYRAEKVLRDVPSDFGAVRAGTSRSALQIVGHLGDLMEWAAHMVLGETRWAPQPPTMWSATVDRLFAGIAAVDRNLATGCADGAGTAIFQGPIADALTHVGQLALLRGIAQLPIRPESYARAEITVGRVGRDQSPRRKEFDGDASARQPAT
jgi:hypothetical protein